MATDGIIGRVTVEDFGARIREVRTARRLSRSELARRSGVAQATLERLEGKDPPQPRRATVIDLARALDWAIDDTLAELGYEPLTDAERAELRQQQRSGDPLQELNRVWPQLTGPQRWAIARTAAVMAEPDTDWQAPVRSTRTLLDLPARHEPAADERTPDSVTADDNRSR